MMRLTFVLISLYANEVYIAHIQVLPSGTVFTWSVTGHITGTENSTGTNLERYSKVFPTAGTYEVAVLGVYTGGSFTTSSTIIIRS